MYKLNRVCNLNSRRTESPRREKINQERIDQSVKKNWNKVLHGSKKLTKDQRSCPSLNISSIDRQNRMIQKNKSLFCLDSIFQLPKVDKECKIDIVDNDFVVQYFENKNRIEVTYRQTSQPENKIENRQPEPCAGISNP